MLMRDNLSSRGRGQQFATKGSWYGRYGTIQYHITCMLLTRKYNGIVGYTILSEIIRYDIIRYDTIRHDTMRYDAIRYDAIRYDTMRYALISAYF